MFEGLLVCSRYFQRIQVTNEMLWRKIIQHASAFHFEWAPIHCREILVIQSWCFANRQKLLAGTWSKKTCVHSTVLKWQDDTRLHQENGPFHWFDHISSHVTCEDWFDVQTLVWRWISESMFACQLVCSFVCKAVCLYLFFCSLNMNRTKVLVVLEIVSFWGNTLASFHTTLTGVWHVHDCWRGVELDPGDLFSWLNNHTFIGPYCQQSLIWDQAISVRERKSQSIQPSSSAASGAKMFWLVHNLRTCKKTICHWLR